jgi:hypothetical protein
VDFGLERVEFADNAGRMPQLICLSIFGLGLGDR